MAEDRGGLTGLVERVHGERRLKEGFLWAHYHDVISSTWYPKGARGVRLAVPRLKDESFDSTFPYGVPELVTGQDTGQGAPGWSITNTDGGIVGLEPQDIRRVAREQLGVPVVDLIDNVIVHELVHVFTNQLAFLHIQEQKERGPDYEPSDAELAQSEYRLSEDEVVKATGVIMTDRTTDAILDWIDEEVL